MTNEFIGEGGPIHVVCAADANYGPFAGITMSSILNENPVGAIHLHLFSDGVTSTDLDRFKHMARRFGGAFSVYDIGQRLDAIPELPKQIHHYTRTTYGRLFFPDFLPKTVRKAIYLDCDIVCRSDLRKLWTLGNNIELLGAVRDPWVDLDFEHKHNLRIPRDALYFNAGVLFINVENWRDSKVGERLIEFLSAPPKTKHADQDAINGVLWKEITEIPGEWNCIVSPPTSQQGQALLENAAILHFCGGFKPWYLGYGLLVGTEAAAFRKAKAASPWRWMLPDFQVRRIKRKAKQLIHNRPTRKAPISQ